MATYDDSIPATSTSRLGLLTQYTGAAASLALMVVIGIWGYKLVVRDVTGIPVVQAMEGAMRVAPENPGGDIARHTGLSVNEVPAEGEAGAMEDTLMLAPAGIDLAAEDIDVQPTAEADEVLPVDPRSETADAVDAVLSALSEDPDVTTGPLDTDDVLALADQIASGATPLSALEEGAVVAPTVTLDGAAVVAQVAVISRDIPGVATSLRPFVRPASLVVPASVDASAPAPEQDVIATSVPVGTKLVQLGAFPTSASATEAWGRMLGTYSDLLGDKSPVVQEVTRNGSTFFRLRIQGFPALADARRLCAELQARNADCIPAVQQ